MTEVTRETVTQVNSAGSVAATTVKAQASGPQTMEYLTYFIFGILEVFLVFRLVLKLTGASQASGFVRFIYGITGIFIFPFEGIFRRGYAQGVETTSVLEPATLVALIVYLVVAWGIVMLIRVLSRQPQE